MQCRGLNPPETGEGPHATFLRSFQQHTANVNGPRMFCRPLERPESCGVWGVWRIGFKGPHFRYTESYQERPGLKRCPKHVPLMSSEGFPGLVSVLAGQSFGIWSGTVSDQGLVSFGLTPWSVSGPGPRESDPETHRPTSRKLTPVVPKLGADTSPL